MSYELINTLASIGTFVVIGTAAVAALIQLGHMRAANQLEAVLSVERDLRSPEIQESLYYVKNELPHKMGDERYRAALKALGFADARTHLELNVLNWFDQVGTLVKNRIVAADPRNTTTLNTSRCGHANGLRCIRLGCSPKT